MADLPSNLRVLSLLAVSALAPAQEPKLQLLDNPGGESSLAIRVAESGGQTMFDVPGWESASGGWIAQNAPWSKVDARSGGSFLRPREGDLAVLRQTVDLVPDGVPRPRYVIAGAFLRTMKGKDACVLRLVLHDATHADLVEVSTEEQRETAWTWHEVFLEVPQDAVRATVELHGIRKDGKFPDTFFDDAALETVGPYPPADLPVRDLLARLDGSRDDLVAWRAAARALAADLRGRRALAERFAAETEPARRRHLLTLLAMSGGTPAEAPLQAALGSSDAAERALALRLLPIADVDAADALVPLAGAEDPKVRADALEALAALGDARALGRIARRDPARAVEVMRAIRSAGVDVEPFYRPVLSPWLGPDEEAGPRNAAMQTLGAGGDRRFLRHLTQLAPSAGSAAVLAGWFRLAAGFGDAEAIGAVVAVVEDGVKFADRALLTVAAELGSPAALDWARRVGLQHESPVLRLAAVRMLRAGADRADVDALRRATEDADPLVALEAVDAVGARTGEDAEELLLRLYSRGRGPVAAAALRELFRRAGGDDAAVERAMGAASGHEEWQVRAAALDLLRGGPAGRAFPVIAAAFTDPVWEVRAAAYRAAATFRDKRAVEALIERAPEEQGPARSFLADALVELTGVDQGDDPAAWQRWWAIVAADFAVPEKSKAGAKDTAARARTTTSYYGIPIRTDNLLFIIDLSGSMTAEIDGRTKLRAAKDELIGVLKALQPTQKFGILAFGTDVGFYEPELVQATPDDVEAAVKWVDRLRIRGATNIYDSLEMALGFEGVDSIFLLSDGGPSAGKFVDMDEIRRAVRLQNRERMVRINTILIGGSAREQAFMRKLAEENHGEVGKPYARTH